MDHQEEQNNEIEALDSIYCGEMESELTIFNFFFLKNFDLEDSYALVIITLYSDFLYLIHIFFVIIEGLS